MSGGVDSSTVAALLLQQGHKVTGITLDLLPSDIDSGGAVKGAQKVCAELGIEHVTLSLSELFESAVMKPFAEGYARGETPNPCILCNQAIKFGFLLEWVLAQGFDKLATGHYAQIVELPALALARPLDTVKDQTYFLYRVPQDSLKHVLFPLGGFTKDEVRKKAHELNVSAAEKAESQDICFTARIGHIGAISRYCSGALEQGVVYDKERNILGSHHGLAHYTIGQRKGLGIGGHGEPLFVSKIDSVNNALIVGSKEDLAVSEVTADNVVVTSQWDGEVEAMIRYNMKPVPATVTLESGIIVATFDEPLYGVAPGQSIVCYRKVGDYDIVVGGGIIACAN